MFAMGMILGVGVEMFPDLGTCQRSEALDDQKHHPFLRKRRGGSTRNAIRTGE